MGEPGPQSWASGASGESSSTDYLLSHSGVFDDDKPMLSAEPMPETGRTSNQKMPAESSFTSEPISSNPMAGTNTGTNTSAGTNRSAGVSVGTSASTSTSAGAGLDDVGIADACDILARAISKELDLLSKAGAKAFEDHDFAAVEKLMRRTSKLKSVQDRMLVTINEWKQEFSEDGQ